jgi:hypothetical protein
MSQRIASVILALIAVGCASRSRPPSGITPTGTSSEYMAQVDRWLARSRVNIQGMGYSRLAAGPVHGNLNDDATASHSLDVVGGNSYALFGVCDNDCVDLDLRIHDQAGNLIMQDIQTNDTPLLTFTANTSGRYRVQVLMAACTRNPCYYGIELRARQ